MLILYLIGIVILCLVVLYMSLYNNNYWKKRNIVGTGELMVKFIFGDQSLGEIIKTVYDKYDEPQIGVYLGAKPTLLLKNAEDIQAVLATDFQSFYSRGIKYNSNDILADNLLFMSDYPKWKLLRQKLSPVFTSMKLKNMHYIIERCARDFVEYVEDNPHLRKKPFNLIYTFTVSSIGASVFGIDTQTKNTMDSPFLDMAWNSIEPSSFINIVAFVSNAFPSLFKLLGLKIFGAYEEFFLGVVRNVIENRKNDTQKRHDFIEICLELQKHGMMQDFNTGYELYPSIEVLAAQAFFFFIAGAETNASTTHFTLIELSNNPHILQKLHEEIDSVFESASEVLTYNDIEKMQYLDKVLSESMRKYPPIGIINRVCTKDTVLPSGVKISKDSAVLIPIYALHRDEKLYPDPELFDPERFAPENIKNIPKHAYLPFGEGNRACIGARYARLTVKTVLAWLLRRFTLVEQNITPKFDKSPFAMRSAGTYYELKLRDI